MKISLNVPIVLDPNDALALLREHLNAVPLNMADRTRVLGAEVALQNALADLARLKQAADGASLRTGAGPTPPAPPAGPRARVTPPGGPAVLPITDPDNPQRTKVPHSPATAVDATATQE